MLGSRADPGSLGPIASRVVHEGIGEADFVAMRKRKDATLEVPTLILPSLQVNVRAGRLPPADDNGVACLRVPVNALPVASKPRAGAGT